MVNVMERPAPRADVLENLSYQLMDFIRKTLVQLFRALHTLAWFCIRTGSACHRFHPFMRSIAQPLIHDFLS